MKIISLFLLIFLFPAILLSQEIKLFTTDGCSVFPDGTSTNQSLWINCCIRHDFAYWKGGTFEERLTADKTLENCVIDLGQPEIAKLMLVGVRAGGSPYFPAPYRWGYGWPFLRGYKALSMEEISDVERKLTLSIETLISLKNEMKKQSKE